MPPYLERRNYARRTVIESRLISVDLGASARGVLIDVGEGGVAVQPFVPLPVGTESDVLFETPNGARVKAHGMVAWVGENGRTGIRFTEVEPEALVEIRRWAESDEAPEAIEQIYRRDAETQSAPRAASPQAFVLQARKATGADGAAIALRDGDAIRCKATIGSAPDIGVMSTPGKGLAGECVQSRRAVLCCDSSRDARVMREAALALNMGSCALVPAVREGVVQVVLAVFSAKVDAFDERTLELLSKLADEVVR